MQHLLNALCEQQREKGSSADLWGFHLLNQYFIFSTLLINSHCQAMTNIIANTYRWGCLFCALIFSSTVTGDRDLWQAPKNMCLLPWQQWFKHQPISMVRQRGCSSFQHRHYRVYSGETSCNTSAAMTGKLLFALFTGRGDRSVSEGCSKLHEKNTVYGFLEHSRNTVHSVTVPELLCVSEEGVERLSPSRGPNCAKLGR